MVAPFLDTRTQWVFKDSMRRLKWTFYLMYVDDFDVWRVNRPAGWADSTSIEVQERIAHGRGKLLPNGTGGPAVGLVAEGVINLESPYRLRTLAFDPATEVPVLIEPGHLLVVRGQKVHGKRIHPARTFRVDEVKRGADDDIMLDVYLLELFTTPTPGEPV
jgi:hypothetical protein